MADDKQKGKFWAHVILSNAGNVIYPEYMEEHDLPYGPEDTENMAKAKMTFGRTVNLGDYNTARIDVGVELPCRVNELDDAYDAAERIIGPKLARLTNNVIQKRKSVHRGAYIIDGAEDAEE